MALAELIEVTGAAARALHGQIPGSINSPGGQRILAGLGDRLADYFQDLRGAVPWLRIETFVRGRLEALGDAEASKLEVAAWRTAAGELVAPAIARLSGDLVGILTPAVAEARDEAECQMVLAGLREALVEPEREIPQGIVLWARQYCGKKVTRIDAESKRRIGEIVANGIRDKAGVDGTAKLLRAEFREFSLTRSRLIANTEINYAMSTGAYHRARLLDSKEKEWITVGDNRVSEGCQTNEAAGRIGYDEYFPSGHALTPRFPGCRCAVAYYRHEAMGERRRRAATKHLRGLIRKMGIPD